jgi:hypothetical protein
MSTGKKKAYIKTYIYIYIYIYMCVLHFNLYVFIKIFNIKNIYTHIRIYFVFVVGYGDITPTN